MKNQEKESCKIKKPRILGLNEVKMHTFKEHKKKEKDKNEIEKFIIFNFGFSAKVTCALYYRYKRKEIFDLEKRQYLSTLIRKRLQGL